MFVQVFKVFASALFQVMLQVSFSLPPWMKLVSSRPTVCSGDIKVPWRR